MQPDLEIVDVSGDESFAAWAHGYPYRTVRWHYHPEYEIQLIVATRGMFFVGDFIGCFEPGNLVLMGPDLPHNWISEVEEGQTVARRGLVLQFGADLIDGLARTLPEFRQARALLSEAAGGLLFGDSTGAAAKPMMEALLTASGLRRAILLLSLFELLLGDNGRSRLASAGYCPEPRAFLSHAINHVLNHIAQNLHTDLREPLLAELVGQSPSAFSRSFSRHTGETFVRYVNRMRIARACELLIHSERPVLEVSLDVGFNNLSNFNRQFLIQKGVPPSKFRSLHRMQAGASAMASSP